MTVFAEKKNEKRIIQMSKYNWMFTYVDGFHSINTLFKFEDLNLKGN